MSGRAAQGGCVSESVRGHHTNKIQERKEGVIHDLKNSGLVATTIKGGELIAAAPLQQYHTIHQSQGDLE